MNHKQEKIIEHLLHVTQQDIVPLTQKGVEQGHKIFGAAILKKEDLSLVIAGTNHEMENPLWHGEVYTIKKLYELPASQRPSPKDCIFFATHEPCPLCLSAITWAGYDTFYYLFDYTDSRDEFDTPEDLMILKEVFKCNNGEYARENAFWKSYGLQSLIDQCDIQQKQYFQQQFNELKTTYDAMLDISQQASKEV